MKHTALALTAAFLVAELIAAPVAAASGKDVVVLSNGIVSVSFNVSDGTFSIRDADGRVRLADAGVGATSVKRGAAFTATTDEVNDVFGHGARVTFTVRDDTAGKTFDLAFTDATGKNRRARLVTGNTALSLQVDPVGFMVIFK